MLILLLWCVLVMMWGNDLCCSWASLISSWAFVVFQQTENKNLSSEQSNICIIYFGFLDYTKWSSGKYYNLNNYLLLYIPFSVVLKKTICEVWEAGYMSHNTRDQAWWGPAHTGPRYSGLGSVKTDGNPVGLWHLTWVWSVFISARQSSPCTCTPYMTVFVSSMRETANQDFLWSTAPGTQDPRMQSFYLSWHI